LQSEIAECGLATVAMVANFYGHNLGLRELRSKFSYGLKGINLQQLAEISDSLNLANRALQCSIEEVHKLQTPCILHWDMNHFATA